MSIDSSGRLLLGTTTAGEGTADDFTIAGSSHTGMTIRSGTSAECNIFFADGTSGNARFRGMVRYFHASDALAFNTSATERLRIDSSGRVMIGTTTAAAFSNRQLSVSSSSGTTSIELRSATDGDGRLIFTDSTSSSDTGSYKCQIKYLQSSDDFIISSNGDNERFRIDSSGDVLIGTTTSAGKLTVDSGTSNTCATFQSSDAGAGINLKDNNARSSIEQNGTDLKISSDTGAEDANSTIRLQIDGSTQIRINADGNTSFNGSSAVMCDIDIEGEIVEIGNPLGNGVSNGIHPVFRAEASNSNKNIVFSSMWGGDNVVHKHLEFTGGANIFYVGTNDAEIARTHSSGFVVGSSSFDSNNSIGVRLLAHGAVHSTRDGDFAYIARRSNSNGGIILFRRDSTDVGNISVTTSATSYNSGSDYRLKQDDTPLIDGLTRLKQLKPIKFKWKNDTSQFVDGFFAHEVSSIVPNAITGEKDAVYEKDDELGHKKGDPIYQQIDHGKLVPLLVAALQEEIVKREELEARVAALEAA